MSYEIAVDVVAVSKCYEIFRSPGDRLKQLFMPVICKLLRVPERRYSSDFWALRDITFNVKKGETVGIIGANGSGKSTLLKLICGISQITAGHVKTQGRVVSILELGTGFNPDFTGRENVYLNGAIIGLSKGEIAKKLQSIINFADIGEYIDRPVKTYSSGMYVRLAFAVAAHADADILIIDEALAVGDVLFNQKCMRFLRDFKQAGSILFVSHSSEAVISLCDRAVWIDKGHLEAVGSAKDVCEKYLANRYASKSKNMLISEDREESPPNTCSAEESLIYRDMRKNFLNNSNFRNDIKIYGFSGEKIGFGTGGASIEYAGMEDNQGVPISWLVGGEPVRIVIKARLSVECKNLIVGFNLKNQFGQVLFGQNTFFDTVESAVCAGPENVARAEFVFRAPLLPIGSYTVDIAVADGTPPDVTQLQWVHDAFILESQSTSVTNGLIGIEFDRISLRTEVAST